jgi:NADPH-dependent glutamate synthase beta subunit-like oxidoreductase/Pyruvate/2-oxoacid:ferredoxin oxidoreductase gamma subunit/NAD-dependent dihydropyrimidine dehydrogenase PreA subunit
LRSPAKRLSCGTTARPEDLAAVQPTDTAHPDYFHRVVDCQWACPAHTDVPEYIRLIANGRFSDAYMVNRESNVFPGILGRVCDRPCEPACRRGRVEDKPVAICRLKRVAADHKDSIVDRLPVVPAQKNGKRVACIGAGPASLTVANDLLPLGYEVVIFEQWEMPGGLMRTNIPAFRLPETVIAEEIGYITGMGAEIRYNSRIESLRKLLGTGGFDAVFVGSGAPKGKELELPGRQEGDANIHIGIQWLESVAFKHLDRIGERVLIIGVGNTAMDCCRSSLRLGAKQVKVMARKPRQFFKASEWELEDAEAENVEIVVNHAPKAFVVEGGRLKGMLFDEMQYEIDARGRIVAERIVGEQFFAADDVILAIGQENAFPWIEDDLGHPVRQVARAGGGREDAPVHPPRRVLRRRRRVWPEEHHLGRRARPPGGDLDPQFLHGAAGVGPPAAHAQPLEPQDGPARVVVQERLQPGRAPPRAPRGPQGALQADQHRGRARLRSRADRGRSAALPELRHPDGVRRKAVHRVRRLHRHLPDRLPHHHANGEEAELSTRLKAPRKNPHQPLYVSGPLKHTARVMVKDEDLCVHCGLCAERCPTAAWDMQKSTIHLPTRPTHMAQPAKAQERVNDFVIKLANVNGTGSASANTLLMKSIFRMGIPVMGKNYFPSNIQGLPTWYEIRVTRDGYVARSGRVDLMVAMNAETYQKDVREVSAGGYLLYDSTWPRSTVLKREDITILGLPLARICNENFVGVRNRILMKNIMYAGVLAALLEIDLDVIRQLLTRASARSRRWWMPT